MKRGKTLPVRYEWDRSSPYWTSLVIAACSIVAALLGVGAGIVRLSLSGPQAMSDAMMGAIILANLLVGLKVLKTLRESVSHCRRPRIPAGWREAGSIEADKAKIAKNGEAFDFQLIVSFERVHGSAVQTRSVPITRQEAQEIVKFIVGGCHFLPKCVEWLLEKHGVPVPDGFRPTTLQTAPAPVKGASA